jgi:solute:Na+ symporter, SSS family
MQAIDWIFFALPLMFVLAVGFYAQRYVRSVADFLSGGRLAGRYLLAVSRGELQAGAVTFVAAFEVINKSGLTLTWWGWINNPLLVIVGISGFVLFRYRETRAMTLAQFFEIRYSKSFRLVTGILGFVAGIANFGIIPAIGSQFFVYFLELPPQVALFGFSVPTFVLLMAAFMSVTLTMTLAGGFITLMVVDCIEGIISQLFYLVIIFGLLATFRWSQIDHVLMDRPAGQSFLNPFHSMGLKDFNVWYVLMGMFGSVYGTMAWQNQSGYNSASLNAHESRMGGILASWRSNGKAAVVVLLGLCGMTFLQHPDFAAQSASAHAALAHIADEHTRNQMQFPVALAHLLPVGVKGALCAILLMGLFGGDSSHLHSWGSIFVQDVIVPLRRKPFTPREHIFVLRSAIFGVALFAFLFGSLFRQTEYIYMWWQVTIAIFVSGAGAGIIGGLYWKKGTTAGAWAALCAGSFLSVSGILAREIYGTAFPLNGTQVGFFSSLIALTLYVTVSLLTCREDFNMDKMLHRGPYALTPTVTDARVDAPAKALPAWTRMIGFDENFSRGDRWIAGSLFGWNMLWFAIFVFGSLWYLIAPWPDSTWSVFWHISAVGLPVFISVVTAIWFTWGGVRDIRALFQRLAAQKIDHRDDGTVVGHHNLDEATLPAEPEKTIAH